MTCLKYIPKNGKEILKVIVNHKVVWGKAKVENKVCKLKYLKSDELYISFEVEAGVWNFTALN